MKEKLHELIDTIPDKYENIFMFLIAIVNNSIKDLPSKAEES